MNIIPIGQADPVYLDDHYFDLKIPGTTLQEKFDVRVLSPDEIYALKPILENWQMVANEKRREYTEYKSKKIHSKNYVNPFENLFNIALDIKVDSRSHIHLKRDIYFGAYNKKTHELQALALVNGDKFESRISYDVRLLVTHPKNIRTRCNKKEERNPGAASSLIYAIANWKDPNEIEELKVDVLLIKSLKGSRTFYQKIGLKPHAPPSRTYWILPISPETKKAWPKNKYNQEFIRTSELDYSDKTEETSEEG